VPEYQLDDGLKFTAKGIIEAHRPELMGVKIAYVFRDEASVSHGKVIVGKCYKVGPRDIVLHGFDFVVEIAQDVWAEATADFQQALMDHELGHIGLDGLDDDGMPKYYLRRHDIEEFSEILSRHGAYHGALMTFLNTWYARRDLPNAPKDSD
jgi:hypothetical protein